MKIIITGLLIGHFSLSCQAGTPQSTQIDSDTGAVTSKIQVHGVSFSLTQLLPEQVLAFYVNRGFTIKQIDSYASSCVYMTVLRNDNAPGTIHFISHNWKVLVDGKPHSLVSVDNWEQQLTTKNTSKAALVAFRWAQFPPEHEYEPGGDWNQGMLSIGLPASSQFDIIARWDIEGKNYEATLRGIHCAQ